jgi:hypothetical protein
VFIDHLDFPLVLASLLVGISLAQYGATINRGTNLLLRRHMRFTRAIPPLVVWLSVLAAPTPGESQVGRTLTQTQTSNIQTNNSILGCESCRLITSATDPHPDTSVPIFAGDPRAGLLPAAVERGLPPNNQFGAGVPDGSSGLPVTGSTSLAFSEPEVSVSFANSLVGSPEPGGGRTNVVTQSIDQVVPGADSATAGLADQQFSVHFQITSLTDPDGRLVGAATGTAVQTLNGVETTTAFSFDATNGLVPAEPFPYVNPSVPTPTP